MDLTRLCSLSQKAFCLCFPLVLSYPILHLGLWQKLLHSKGNDKQNEKTTYRMAENICKWCDLQGINFQNIQTAHTTQYKKKKKPQSKNGQNI